MASQTISIHQGGQLLTTGLTFDSNGEATVVIKYVSTDPTTTGLGLEFLFDGSKLDFVSVQNVLSSDLVVGGVESGDGTNQKLSFGWASVFGQWPGDSAVDLASVTIKDRGNAGNNTGVFLAFTSVTAGFDPVNENPQTQNVAEANTDLTDVTAGFLDESEFQLKLGGLEIDTSLGSGGLGIQGKVKISDWEIRKVEDDLVFYYANVEKFRLANDTGASTVSARYEEFKYVSVNNRSAFGGIDDFGETLSYTPGKLVCFMNGVRLAANIDFTANNGSTVIFNDATSNGDIILLQSL